jgi:hypothetical protein
MSSASISLQPPPGGDIQIDGQGCYDTTLDPQSIYSFTTLGYINKGEPTPPVDANLPLPYADTFDGTASTRCARSGGVITSSYAVGDLPCFFSDQEGAFEIRSGCTSNTYAGGSGGKCVEQVVDQQPVNFLGCQGQFSDAYPCGTSPVFYTHLGETDASWGDYDTSILFNPESGGIIRFFARMINTSDTQGAQANGTLLGGYEFDINTTTGEWDLGKRYRNGSVDPASLDFGSYADVGGSCHSGSCLHPLTANTWHRLKLRVTGTTTTTVTVCLDTTELDTITDDGSRYGPAFTNGQVGLATMGTKAQFDDIRVNAPTQTVCG